MEQNEFFEKAIKIPELIESKQNEICRLKKLAYSLTAVNNEGDRVQSSKNIGCKYAELINKAVDLEAEILDDVQKLIDYQKEVSEVIDKLSDPTCRLIMRELYLDGLSVKDVAHKHGYSIRHIYGLRSKSIKECAKLQ